MGARTPLLRVLQGISRDYRIAEQAGCTVQEENRSVPRCYIRHPFGVVFNIGQARTGA